MSKQCLACQGSVIAVAGGSRDVALMRFAQLQRAGFLPAMCEAADGRYTVCYDVAGRTDQLPASAASSSARTAAERGRGSASSARLAPGTTLATS